MAYSIDGLKNGILGCKKNIRVLEDAIAKERQTMADYRGMIDDLERAAKAKEEAEASVHIEVEVDNGVSE